MENMSMLGRLIRTRVVVLAVFFAVALGVLAAGAKPALANHDYTTKDCESYLAARALHTPVIGNPDVDSACLWVDIVDSNGVSIPQNKDADGDGYRDVSYRFCSSHQWTGVAFSCAIPFYANKAVGIDAASPANAAMGDNYSVRSIQQWGCEEARAASADPQVYSNLVYGDIVRVTLVDSCGPASASPPPAADTKKPTISGTSPKHRSTTRDRTPTVKATVKDNITNLQKSNIKLYVAGKRITKFRYSAATDRLTYTSRKLPKGKKVVKIVARDGVGNVAIRSWFFRIR